MYISEEIVIDRNPLEVFNYTHAVETLTVWYTFITAAEHVEGEAVWPAKGGKILVHFEVAKQPFTAECVSVSSRPGEEMLYTLVGKLISGTQHWKYAGENGGTRVTATLDQRFPLGVFGDAFYNLGMKQATHQLQKSLVNLKVAIEGG